jgi:predicted GIY-YIG superfamily endonuclease
MAGWAYILECSDGSFYVGSTVDLEVRLWEHNQGLGAAYERAIELAGNTAETAYLTRRRDQLGT